MRQQLSINNPHPSFFQQKSVHQGVCEFFLNVSNGALAVEERGIVEDPLTIASQSRDDFFWGRFLTKTRDGSIGKRLRAIEG